MFSKRSIFTTAGLILLVGLTNYLSLKSISRRAHEPKGVHVTGIAEKLTIEQMTLSGHPDYIGKAKKAVRYSDGKARLYRLKAELFNQRALSPWYATADNAWSYPGNSKVNLWGNVHLWRKKTPLNKAIDYQSPQLTLYPHRNYAETKTTVRISEPGTPNITTAVGMKAWPKVQRVKLLSKVKSIYEAPQKTVSTPHISVNHVISIASNSTTE